MRPSPKHLIGLLSQRYLDVLEHFADLRVSLTLLIKRPIYAPGDSVGFNGQRHRKGIFSDLLNQFRFETILEAGTWTGNTTAYMAQSSGLRVHSCEINRRFHMLARVRLRTIPGIYLQLSDSRRFLLNCISLGLAGTRSFIYLDAHWYQDLPLREELQIIAENWKEVVIMIDDFQVPGDPGYGHDNYGPGKELSMHELAAIFDRLDFVPFFPAQPSTSETGAKRGCVVLGQRGTTEKTLRRVHSLSVGTTE